MSLPFGLPFALDATSLSFIAAATGVGFVHTLAGPDHYLPFIAMAKAGHWSRKKTMVVTLLCGLGHVTSSLLLAALGALLFTSFERAAGAVDAFADVRAKVATWALIVFGTLYAVWGLKRAFRGSTHTHVHAHADGTVHGHGHGHDGAHLHPHVAPAAARPRSASEYFEPASPGCADRSQRRSSSSTSLEVDVVAPPRARPARSGSGLARILGRAPSFTPWILFTIFVFGPCEPLLPLVLAPQVAGQRGLWLLVVLSFTLATLTAMTAVVLVALRSTELLPTAWSARLARFQHALAGSMIAACGVAMHFGM